MIAPTARVTDVPAAPLEPLALDRGAITHPEIQHAPTGRLVAAFACVYLIWGSTFLAIRFAIETIPPFLMAGVRFAFAGLALYAWAILRGAERPTWRHWRSALIIGASLFLVSHGGVVWSEQRIPSGLAAVLIGTVPLWMALLDWTRVSRVRPHAFVIAGLIVGFAGVALLVGRVGFAGPAPDPIACSVIVCGSFSWAAGSLYSRRAPLPTSPALGTAMNMLAGGVLLILLGLATGETRGFHASAISTRSWISVTYLSIFGSLIAFSAYTWLLKHTTPARAATYGYVNPVVAILLGWALAGEPLTVRTVAASAVILSAVVMITTAPTRRRVAT